MKNLIDKLPELYQDIEFDGKVIKGNRECQKRWEVIKQRIRPHDVVLDLGSSVGFFAHKIAKEYPDSLVLSFESDPVMCEIQKRIFKHEGIYNVVVCNHRLSADDLEKWSKHVEIFNTILALSVMHHFPKDDVKRVWKALGKMCSEIIVEVPENEKEACGGEAKEIASLLSGTGWALGMSPSHLGDYTRQIRSVPVGGTRKDLDAFFGVSHHDRHKFTVQGNKINGKHIIKGVNVWNLLHFNVVWPEPKWWRLQTRRAYVCLDKPTDIRPWNLLVTSTGVVAIDYKTKFKEGEKGEYNPDDIEKLDKVFETMNPKEYEYLIEQTSS